VTIAAIVLAASAREIRERWFGPRLPYQVIHTVKDLREAASAQRSMIYFDVEWSIDAAKGRTVYRDFAQDWQKSMPNTPVKFYVLDLTDRENEAVKEAVRIWGQSVSTGSGELVWLRDGIPQRYIHGTAGHSHADLAEIARQAFGLSSVASFPGNPKVSKKSEPWYWDEDDDHSNPSSVSESR
jgi:hypothetical protein